MITFAATGHRPHKLGGYGSATRDKLRRLALDYLERECPDEVISGMAQGWDQAWAEAALELQIPFIAVIPSEDQPSVWPASARRRYRALLDHAADVEIIDRLGTMRIVVALQKRNEWMVDHCDRLVALWDGSFGGTHNCIVYARKVGRTIDNIWQSYEALL